MGHTCTERGHTSDSAPRSVWPRSPRRRRIAWRRSRSTPARRQLRLAAPAGRRRGAPARVRRPLRPASETSRLGRGGGPARRRSSRYYAGTRGAARAIPPTDGIAGTPTLAPRARGGAGERGNTIPRHEDPITPVAQYVRISRRGVLEERSRQSGFDREQFLSDQLQRRRGQAGHNREVHAARPPEEHAEVS